MPTMDPEAVITSFYQPHIVLGEMALWGVLEDRQNLGSVLCLSFFSFFSGGRPGTILVPGERAGGTGLVLAVHFKLPVVLNDLHVA